MVEFGRRLAADHELPHLDYRLGDIEDPPIDDASVDLRAPAGAADMVRDAVPAAGDVPVLAEELHAVFVRVFDGVVVIDVAVIGARPHLPAALACYERAIEMAPDLPAAWINRGLAYERLGHTGQADQAGTHQPGSRWQRYRSRGAVYLA